MLIMYLYLLISRLLSLPFQIVEDTSLSQTGNNYWSPINIKA